MAASKIEGRGGATALLKYAWPSLSTFSRKLRRNNTRGLYSAPLILTAPLSSIIPGVVETRRSHLLAVVGAFRGEARVCANGNR